jgi:hypothetical protein
LYYHPPYRQTKGIARGHDKGRLPSIPDYTTISRRINKLDIKIQNSKSKYFEDNYIVIAIYSTDIKVTNRGQLIKEKWNIRKGYLKIHISTNVKTKEILSIKVTADEHVHDSKELSELVDNIIKSNKIIGKLFVDGTYEGNDIFRYLSTGNGILPCIKVRKNAQVRLKKGHILRNLSVISQKNDLKMWKYSIVSYGQRWIVIETVFSSIKRMFMVNMFI